MWFFEIPEALIVGVIVLIFVFGVAIWEKFGSIINTILLILCILGGISGIIVCIASIFELFSKDCEEDKVTVFFECVGFGVMGVVYSYFAIAVLFQ